MNIEQLSDFFKWMTIINIALLLFSSFVATAFKSMILSLHSKMFGVTETQISLVIYAYLAAFKVLIIVFNIVPFIVLQIIN